MKSRILHRWWLQSHPLTWLDGLFRFYLLHPPYRLWCRLRLMYRASRKHPQTEMHMVPMKEAKQVAIKTAVLSIPALERIFGFSARIYAMVINVVRPAIISVETFVLFSLSLNKRFSMGIYRILLILNNKL